MPATKWYRTLIRLRVGGRMQVSHLYRVVFICNIHDLHGKAKPSNIIITSENEDKICLFLHGTATGGELQGGSPVAEVVTLEDGLHLCFILCGRGQFLKQFRTSGKVVESRPLLISHFAVAQVPCRSIATQRTLYLCTDIAHLYSLQFVRFGVGLEAELDAVLSVVDRTFLRDGLSGVEIDRSTKHLVVVQCLVFRAAVCTNAVARACFLTRIVIYRNEQTLCSVVLEWRIEVNNRPHTLCQPYRTAEHFVAFRNGHPVGTAVERRLAGVRQVDVVVTLTTRIVVVEGDAGN